MAKIKKDDTRYSKGSVGGSLYSENSNKTKEYIQVSRKTKIPGIVKLSGPVYEVPRGSMKTAQTERGKTSSRASNVAKRSEVAANRKVVTKKLAKATSKVERGKTQSRANVMDKRKKLAADMAKKPKKLY